MSSVTSRILAPLACSTLLMGAALAGPAAAQAATAPPWSPALGHADTFNYESCGAGARCPGEYGVDVPLPSGTAIIAPESGTIVDYQPCPPRKVCWAPGRLLLRLDRGGTLGFGHVNNGGYAPGTHVSVGQRIATIGDNGNNSHVEFMYSPSNTANYTPSDFTAYPLTDPRSPKSLLASYMTTPRLAYQPVSQSVVGPAGQAVDLAHAFVGETGTLNVTVKNTGSATWNSNVHLATDQPQNRSASLLYNPGWMASSRPAAVTGTVAPGATYTFSVPVTVGGQNPSPTTPASFKEAFTLVDEGVAWFPAADAVLDVSLTRTVDRGIVFRHYGSGGYSLAPDGTVTAFGGAPALKASATWPDWSIARGIVLRSDDTGGYVLDGWGGVHPFGNAPALKSSAFWQGWDIARAIVLRSDNLGGYVLDGWGALHPFGNAPTVTGSAYWNGSDIARGASLTSDSGGYVLDGWGGLHPFGNAQPVAATSYWSGWDIARGVASTAAGAGYVLDGWGAPHAFGSAHAASGFAYWSGTDTAKAIAITRDATTGATTGATVDETGTIHPFTP